MKTTRPGISRRSRRELPCPLKNRPPADDTAGDVSGKLRAASMRALFFAFPVVITLCPAVGRAQTPRDPAPPLRIATQSRPAESERELRARVNALLDQENGDVSQLPPESVHVLEQVL